MLQCFTVQSFRSFQESFQIGQAYVKSDEIYVRISVGCSELDMRRTSSDRYFTSNYLRLDACEADRYIFPRNKTGHVLQ